MYHNLFFFKKPKQASGNSTQGIKGAVAVKLLITGLTCLVLGGGLFGLGYWQGGRAMRQQMNALAAKGTSSQQANNYPRPGPNSWMAPQAPVAIPANATPELREYLENRQTLIDKFSVLRSQTVNGAPNPQAFAEFQQQNAAMLKRQDQLAQIIGQQRAMNPLPEPPPLKIPPDATPQLKAYLTARDKLMRDQVAFMNQHRADDPKAREADMRQWGQQNAVRFQQLRQLSQAAQAAQPAATPIPPTTTTK